MFLQLNYSPEVLTLFIHNVNDTEKDIGYILSQKKIQKFNNI